MTKRAKRVLVRFRAGPTWGSGPPEAQPDWDAHAAFVDALVERGVLVMGGPFQDSTGAMLVLENVDEEEARSLVEPDPFVLNGVFLVDDVREWVVYVDELTAARVGS